MRLVWFVLAFACEDKISESVHDDPWGNQVTPVSIGSDSLGDLALGAPLDSLDWSSDGAVACWPGNEDVNFTGAHVFYSAYQSPHSKVTATVIPEDSTVDVNVYVLQQAATSYQVPPAVTSVVSCEVGFPQSTDSNPGEPDSAYVIAIEKAYNLLIGVAGPQDVITGGYTLQIRSEEY